MADVAGQGLARSRAKGNWLARLIASRKFQKWAASFPLTKGIVRREGEALFDLLAGFCHSQILMALVKLNILTYLIERPATAQALAIRCSVPLERMEILLRASVSLNLIKRKRGGRYSLTKTGAALIGVPGLPAMISHHDVLYRDLADPVAFFRGETETELAGFWPYVFGGEMDRQVAATYSDLMAESQVLVAEDTLRAVSFKGIERIVDVGGGSGVFLEALGQSTKDTKLVLFDLPQVAPLAEDRFVKAGLSDRTSIVLGSFRDDPLPEGCDAISLVRVLYDHDDASVSALLAKCFAALPDGGRLIISEPMSGGERPNRPGDAYFSLYTLAMRTGKTRSASQIEKLCRDAGFGTVYHSKALRSFVTKCLDVRKT